MSNGTKNPFEKAWRELETTTGSKKVEAFLSYCSEIIKSKNDNKLQVKDVSYWICSAVSIKGLDGNKLVQEILDVACDLELSDERKITESEQSEMWQQLTKLVDEVKKEV
jgi:uncharacterized protein YajQ (UPF0234 family)